MCTTLIAAGVVLLGQAESANYSYSELSHRGGFTGGLGGTCHVPPSQQLIFTTDSIVRAAQAASCLYVYRANHKC